MKRARVLVALTVYNGRHVVPAALASLSRQSGERAAVDVLVLDDASPDPEFSADLVGWCREHGAQLYRSPRNLGIPRNVNLGLLAAMEHDYDHVVISNSDVVYAQNAIDQLVAAADADPRIGAVTAWSTNVSVYSIPNQAPDVRLASQGATDEVGAALAAAFGSRVLDVPAGISFAMLVPVPVLRTVGLMDPVFGRGYCEETDWSRRCLDAGFRVTLGLGSFVYHAGGGSTVAAGLLADGHTTVPANERIIDLRYPDFRDEVDRFCSAGTLQDAHRQAITAVIDATLASHGVDVVVGLRPTGTTPSPTHCDIVVAGDAAEASIDAYGFVERFAGNPLTVAQQVRDRIGAVDAVDLYDVVPWAWRVADVVAGGAPVHQRRNYPARV